MLNRGVEIQLEKVRQERSSKRQLSDPVWQNVSASLMASDNEELLYFLYQGLVFAKQDSLMVRCRMSGGELSSKQLDGLVCIAQRYGGGYADITTRANFQIRDIAMSDGLAVLRALVELDLVPSVKGLNNLRNVTVTPTSGFDAVETIDLQPLAHEITQAMLFQPALQGLPGKFNLGLDSGGRVSVASEANDIGVRAVERDGQVFFRLSFANLKSGGTVAEDAGWLLRHDQVVSVVSSVISVFLEHGDFSKRLRSRLKFYVAEVGMESFKEQVTQELGFSLVSDNDTRSHENGDDLAHSGVWEQKQKGYHYVGIHGATGRYTTAQLSEIAILADKFGRGVVRLTTQQTCLLPWIKNASIEMVLDTITRSDMSVGSKYRGSIVACTGNQGCSYSATDTKRHAKELQHFLETSDACLEPLNIHFTGCPFSCAQSYIGDIGLLGSKLRGAECYHVFLGGGAGTNTTATKVRHGMGVAELYQYICSLLKNYSELKHCGEDFCDFVKRIGIDNAALGKETRNV